MDYKELSYFLFMENEERKAKCIYAETCGDTHDCVSCPHYRPADNGT